jgi:hypothetical protein
MLRALLLDVFGSDSGFEAGGVSLPEVGPERLSSQVSCCLGLWRFDVALYRGSSIARSCELWLRSLRARTSW